MQQSEGTRTSLSVYYSTSKLEVSYDVFLLLAETVWLFSDAEEQMGKKNPCYKECDIDGTTCSLIIHLSEVTLPSPSLVQINLRS